MRHESLPQHMTAETLAHWLEDNAKEEFTEEKRYYYTPDEIIEFQKKSSDAGREINRLQMLKKQIADMIQNGNFGDDTTIDIPETVGVKILLANRKYADDAIETGYESEQVKIYGIPMEDTETMEFFDLEGTHYPGRSRSLSAREKQNFIGLFQNDFKLKRANN